LNLDCVDTLLTFESLENEVAKFLSPGEESNSARCTYYLIQEMYEREKTSLVFFFQFFSFSFFLKLKLIC